ncbi:Divalent-cation tolerance protein CutA [Pseudoalteromonas holothuriae]|uniref:Divalent-cation tolerance protein CutA n=1 Tax=Pseudoalteromonas holothuriae TaxID=2963714 RepID=A0A9W4QVE1_9GAMM|nr:MULTISPECIES: divalent-cation tolerance protein CutA [unclassified Pseudoalteromonas]CAH9054792.1 Divalent-cation tolerance protein CutA [Pseudoalteromonas sp. CIP111854]CAH9068412.1 Divalent-cation tolerance protein CutA [Pseudoalteromonas sp. CIP111951]
MAPQYKLIMTTCENQQDANQLANQLVVLKLAACVNILPAVESVYMWQGEVVQHTETKLFIKTKSEKLSKVINTIKELHSYEVPEIQVLDVTGGNLAYFNWMDEVLN